MKIYDISPVISERIAVFPGDTPFKRDVLLNQESGDNILLSKINTTVHLGAHADGPNHYGGRESIAERNLDYYIGPCQVITVSTEMGERIYPEDLEGIDIEESRVLFHTGSFPDPDNWNGDFNSLSPELIQFLARQDVKLVGIDTPSVDPAESKELESHAAIRQNDMAILEGLVLKDAPDGFYELIALPLRIEGCDASPVRAVLRSV